MKRIVYLCRVLTGEHALWRVSSAMARIVAAEWREEDHPRRDDGKFGTGSGGGGGGESGGGGGDGGRESKKSGPDISGETNRHGLPMVEDEGTHRSPSPDLKEITSSGTFGGIFGGGEDGGMYGKYLYKITSPNHLTNYTLNYEIENAWEEALRVTKGDEELAEIIMKPGCQAEKLAEERGEDPTEYGFEAQRLRGELARRLGFTSIEMEDETGRSTLFLPGSKVEKKPG